MLIVYVHNDGTGTNERANYSYQVCVNDVVIETGRVTDHNRDDGWRALLGQIAEKLDENIRQAQ